MLSDSEKSRTKGAQNVYLYGKAGLKEGQDESSTKLEDVGEDSLCAILSFLSPIDVGRCACVNTRMWKICKDDKKVWFSMCQRRWGCFTKVIEWAAGCLTFKAVYEMLQKWENLIGFWRGVGDRGHGSLVVFEWGSHFIKGFRVVPACRGSYQVCKIPLLWIGISASGREMCLMNPTCTLQMADKTNRRDVPSTSSNQVSCHNCVIEDVNVSSIKKELTEDPFQGSRSEKSGLVVVDLHFVGSTHIVLEEIQHRQYSGKNLILAEAAASASFGSSSVSHVGGKGHASRSNSEIYSRSPPGSFPYEMYQFLTNKITSPGSDRAVRKQRRRERERAGNQGRWMFDPEHFVKISNSSPTKERPLQGLWKGICHCMGLDFVLVSYDEQGIVCRRIGEGTAVPHSGPICWIARLSVSSGMAMSKKEQLLYNSRRHITAVKDDDDEVGIECDHFLDEVVAMFSTTADKDFCTPGFSNKTTEGRAWLYGCGGFGFGLLHTNYIIDYRPICVRQGLLHVHN